MVTFKVDKVTAGTHKASEYLKSDQNLQKLAGLGMEATSSNGDEFTHSNNNFVAALNTAYDQHLPLVLSPDVLWLTLAQGLSLHINNNAEELRHQFVNFEGKQYIEIIENSFIKGSPDNNWEHAFGQFSDKIAEFIGKKRDLIVGDYSTSTPVTRAAGEIVLMEAMSKYFDYGMRTCCGIPEITLLGTVEDWKAIKGRVQAMAELNLGWWTSKVEPIVDEFISAAQGNAKKDFWQKIYKVGGGSGGPYLAGWMTNLFPYLRDRQGSYTRQNEFNALAEMCRGLTTDEFPNGLAKASFTWLYYDDKFNMELGAGFTGYKVENNAVVPNIGWTVRDVDRDVHVELIPTDSNLDYKQRDELLKRVSSEAQQLGLKVSSGWRSVTGVIAKEKLPSLKNIAGVKIVEGGQDDD